MTAGRRRIPPSVWLAAASLAAVVVVQAALAVRAGGGGVGLGRFAFAAALAAALLAGLLRGSRLAWMWGRWLALFLGIIVAARAAVAVTRGEAVATLAAAVLAGLALPLLVAAAALSRSSAIAFYRLVCPLCQKATRASNDMLFRQARCRACGNVW